ncbi:MAG TPA: hypothetical protein PLN94_12430, partial [Thiolinea sp.]|nr:hypothetical protein [Thiolinea sp.]
STVPQRLTRPHLTAANWQYSACGPGRLIRKHQKIDCPEPGRHHGRAKRVVLKHRLPHYLSLGVVVFSVTNDNKLFKNFYFSKSCTFSSKTGRLAGLIRTKSINILFSVTYYDLVRINTTPTRLWGESGL